VPPRLGVGPGWTGPPLVPGLIDAHCHLADIGYLAAVADCIHPSAARLPSSRLGCAKFPPPPSSRTPRQLRGVTLAGTWSNIRDGRIPPAADCDQAVRYRRAVLYHTSLPRACVLTIAALRAACFEDRQPYPPGAAFAGDGECRYIEGTGGGGK